jgi:hypothetical protein
LIRWDSEPLEHLPAVRMFRGTLDAKFRQRKVVCEHTALGWYAASLTAPGPTPSCCHTLARPRCGCAAIQAVEHGEKRLQREAGATDRGQNQALGRDVQSADVSSSTIRCVCIASR